MAAAPLSSVAQIAEQLELLEGFLSDLGEFWNQKSDAARSRLNKTRARVRRLVAEAGCHGTVTIYPPPALGGVVLRDIDPFDSLFDDFRGESLIPRVRDMVEAAIGVMQTPGYQDRLASASGDSGGAPLQKNLARVEQICRRFPRAVRELQVRHDARPTVSINDEYDVQDLLRALLRLDFDDVRVEEWTPSYAGGTARMDFLLKAERIVIETKKTREGLTTRQLGNELLIDIARYRGHPDCGSLFCFIYDPDHRIKNRAGLEGDLTRTHDGLNVMVLVAPSEQ